MNNKLWRSAVTVVAVATLAASVAGCSSGSGDGKVTLEIFQSKTEAIGTVDELIAEFTKTHPDIEVKQTAVQDAVTVLKSRLAKGDVPDVISLNVSAYYDMARGDLLTDLKGTDALDAVSDEGALDYLKEAGQTTSDLAVPWATNAQLVLYNVDQYAEYGLTPPTTWSEFLGNAKTIEQKDGTPFVFGWKDTWPAMALVNSVVASVKPDDLLAQLQDGDTTFEKQPEWKEATEAMLALKDYAQPDAFGADYNNALAAFANGEGTMYVDGTWALPTIAKANPDLNVGAFVMPSPDPAFETKVPAGPDSFLSISKDTEHPKEAQEFLDFLMSEPAQKTFSDEQFLFSVRSDVQAADPLMSALKTDWIDSGKTATYSDGMFAGGTNYQPISWEYLNSDNSKDYLAALDKDFQTYGLKPGK